MHRRPGARRLRRQDIVGRVDVIAGVIAVAVRGIGGDIEVDVADVRRRGRPRGGNRLGERGRAVLEKLDREVGTADAVPLYIAIVAEHELAWSGGEIAGLAISQIAFRTRGKLKTINPGHRVRNHDRERLRYTGRVGLTVWEVDRDVPSAGVERKRVVASRRGAGELIVTRRRRMARLGTGRVRVEQNHGRDHRDDGPSDPGSKHVTVPGYSAS